MGKKNETGCGIAGATIVAIIIMFMLFNVFSGPDEPEEFVPDKSYAFHYATDKVEKQLKSPSTADFASIHDSETKIRVDGDQYHIKSYVDSQNGFGATVRTYFECTVYFEGEMVGVKGLKFID